MFLINYFLGSEKDESLVEERLEIVSMGKFLGECCGKGEDINGVVVGLIFVKWRYVVCFICCFIKIEIIIVFLNVDGNDRGKGGNDMM